LRPEEPQELTNPLNWLGISCFYTLTIKLEESEAWVVELYKGKENSEVIYGTLMRTRQPFDTGCSDEY
jgi:hypothetical protein